MNTSLIDKTVALTIVFVACLALIALWAPRLDGTLAAAEASPAARVAAPAGDSAAVRVEGGGCRVSPAPATGLRPILFGPERRGGIWL